MPNIKPATKTKKWITSRIISTYFNIKYIKLVRKEKEDFDWQYSTHFLRIRLLFSRPHQLSDSRNRQHQKTQFQQSKRNPCIEKHNKSKSSRLYAFAILEISNFWVRLRCKKERVRKILRIYQWLSTR